MYFSFFFLIEKFWYYLFYGIVLVLWVWTNLDKEIDPYTYILGTKEEMVYVLKFLLEVHMGDKLGFWSNCKF